VVFYLENTPLSVKNEDTQAKEKGTRMKKGFTLIEMLVVMVLIALLVGLLLPSLARAKEEARKTQCRSNLAQIGLAYNLYAEDNRRFSPPWGGGSSYTSPDGHTTFGVSSKQAMWLGLVITSESQTWNTTKSTPGRPIGLGLLFAGGYLTSRGAQILYCPSNNSGRKIRELYLSHQFHYDADEPFWTSHGLVVISDNDGFGDKKKKYRYNSYSNSYESEMEPGMSGGMGSGMSGMEGGASMPPSDMNKKTPTKPPSNQSKKVPKKKPNPKHLFQDCTKGYKNPVNPNYCLIFSNYTMRWTLKGAPSLPGHNDRWPDNSFNMDKFGPRGILADHLQLTTENTIRKEWTQLGGSSLTPNGKARAEYIFRLRENIITNHDNSYNVLFPNGSVKTYTDSTGNLLWQYVKLAHYLTIKDYTDGSPYEHGDATHPERFAEPLLWDGFLDKSCEY